LHAPRERQHRRGHAETHSVRQRIHLAAEIAGGVGHARDAAVQTVEEHGRADGLGRHGELIGRAGAANGRQHGTAERSKNRKVAEKNVARGE
jgi:hypothetical protein